MKWALERPPVETLGSRSRSSARELSGERPPDASDRTSSAVSSWIASGHINTQRSALQMSTQIIRYKKRVPISDIYS